jgi:hypothetical protein
MENRKPSLMSLLLQMSVNGDTLATGTGFVAQGRRGPVLITCRHNLTGRNCEDLRRRADLQTHMNAGFSHVVAVLSRPAYARDQHAITRVPPMRLR